MRRVRQRQDKQHSLPTAGPEIRRNVGHDLASLACVVTGTAARCAPPPARASRGSPGTNGVADRYGCGAWRSAVGASAHHEIDQRTAGDDGDQTARLKARSRASMAVSERPSQSTSCPFRVQACWPAKPSMRSTQGSKQDAPARRVAPMGSQTLIAAAPGDRRLRRRHGITRVGRHRAPAVPRSGCRRGPQPRRSRTVGVSRASRSRSSRRLNARQTWRTLTLAARAVSR